MAAAFLYRKNLCIGRLFGVLWELDCGLSAGLSPPDPSEVRQAGEARDDGIEGKTEVRECDECGIGLFGEVRLF